MLAVTFKMAQLMKIFSVVCVAVESRYLLLGLISGLM